MHVGDRKRPPRSPQEGWLSDGRQVLHFQPRRYDRWSQSLEVTLGELIPGQAAPLLKRRKELTHLRNRDSMQISHCCEGVRYCRGGRRAGILSVRGCARASQAGPPPGMGRHGHLVL
jgi:hypothetical protein